MKNPPFEGTILRRPYTDQGTLGVLTIPLAGFTCFSIELPWRENQNSISCIPADTYLLFRRWSAHWNGFVYQFRNVPQRIAIQSHSGNVAGDKSLGYRSHSLGCVLLGSCICKLWGQLAVGNSRHTYRRFLNAMQGRDLLLEIREADNG
ncbi:DUF5675 family protein [Maridesulfovibrio bastinii]|uniref:DUF5675 family protein n=1 Tax=Maridesulfovibrio bastinii TaxID=47157 RepID=UPI000406C922|nr:DUF5675 family protein [Maridesulfovibrio bastinii]